MSNIMITTMVKRELDKKDLEIQKLKKQVEKLKECVEFYANKTNYPNRSFSFSERWNDLGTNDFEKLGETEESGKPDMFGGKLARQTLKELGIEDKE